MILRQDEFSAELLPSRFGLSLSDVQTPTTPVALMPVGSSIYLSKDDLMLARDVMFGGAFESDATNPTTDERFAVKFALGNRAVYEALRSDELFSRLTPEEFTNLALVAVAGCKSIRDKRMRHIVQATIDLQMDKDLLAVAIDCAVTMASGFMSPEPSGLHSYNKKYENAPIWHVTAEVDDIDPSNKKVVVTRKYKPEAPKPRTPRNPQRPSHISPALRRFRSSARLA